MPEDFRYMSVRFQMERRRLQDFSKVAGLVENIDNIPPSRSIRANKLSLLAILTEIRCLLEAFAKANGRYNSYTTKDLEDLKKMSQDNLPDAFSSLANPPGAIQAKSKLSLRVLGSAKSA